jgi:hypothetical protein
VAAYHAYARRSWCREADERSVLLIILTFYILQQGTTCAP